MRFILLDRIRREETNLISNLEGFDDEFDKCNERILEAIQALWIEEED